MYRWRKLHCLGGSRLVVVGGEGSSPSPVRKRKRDDATDYYAYGVVLPDKNVHWVPPDFALRTDYLEAEKRMSIAHDGTRWFRTRDDAKLHCVLSLLVLRRELFKPGSPGAEILSVPHSADIYGEELYLPGGGREAQPNDEVIESVKVLTWRNYVLGFVFWRCKDSYHYKRSSYFLS